MSNLLPVLVADLAEDSARDFLLEVARGHGEAWVPLVAAPADTTTHLLEIYAPASQEPLRLLAEPLGPPGEHGFPLRLATMEEDAIAAPLIQPVEERDKRRAETPTAFMNRRPAGAPRKPAEAPLLSPQHAAELAGEPPRPRSAGDDLEGLTLAEGKLELEELLGRGALGSVYRARHRQLFVPVAVKILHEDFQSDIEFCRRFYAEALAASRLDHANLVRVFDFGQEPDGRLYISMEYLEGISLRELIAGEGPLPAARIADIMLQICAGLGHAHARGLVHRDVRPENVLLLQGHDDDGHPKEIVKVQDFGVALLKSKGAERRQELLRQSPEYMSPEQCRNEEIDYRSDVYSCGIVLYELATGQVPFQSDKPIVVVNRHLSMTPPPVDVTRPGVDPRIDVIVQRALRKSRADRYADLREMRADLKALLRTPMPSVAGETPVFDLEAEAVRMAAKISSSVPPATGRGRASRSSIPAPSPNLSIPPAPSFAIPPSQPAASDAYSYDRSPRAAPVEPRTSSVPPARTSESPVSSESPASSESPPKPRPTNAPAWLEARDEGFAKFLGGMGEVRTEELAGTLSSDPARWLGKLTTERDIRTFAKMLTELETAIKTLAARADAKALWAVSSALHGLATEGTQGPGTRGARAALMMRFFSEPGVLSPVAERLLTREDDAREAAQTLLRRAGVAGAYALYGARVTYAPRLAVRAPFVATMRMIGEPAWPVVRAALEKIPESARAGGHPLAASLAEDLLLSVPAVRDETAGHVVARFVRATVPGLCRAAAVALAKLWAERAAPILLGLLGEPDPSVRAAALVGLRHVGAVDEHVVRRLLPIVRRAEPATPELLLAVVSALEGAAVQARPLALELLIEIVRGEATDDGVVLAAARALIALAGPQAKPLVSERADRSHEPLRSRLRTLIAA